MVFGPAGNFAVVYFVEPELIVTFARTVAPFRNCTVPVGVPAADVMVAVKVTTFPNTEGLTDETSVVVLVELVTTCDNTVEVLPVRLESPP